MRVTLVAFLFVQELPDGSPLTSASFETVMEGSGVVAEEAHEALAGLRGRLNARHR